MLRVACATLLCALAVAAAAAHAAEPGNAAAPIALSAAERAWLAQHPRPRVITKTEWAPIDLYTYEGQFRGLSGDYLALIAQRLNTTFEFKAAPTLAHALDALERGEADILPSVSRTPQRQMFMDFSQPYLDVPNVYVTRRDVRAVGSDQSMTGLRIAVEKGYAVAALIRERHPQAIVVDVADSASALRAVSRGIPPSAPCISACARATRCCSASSTRRWRASRSPSGRRSTGAGRRCTRCWPSRRRRCG